MGVKSTPEEPTKHHENLNPIKDHDTAVRLGRKGGLANKNNPNSIIASKLRWLKKKGMNDESAMHLYEVITEHNLSALDVRLFLESIKKDTRTVRDKNELARSLIEWHKMTHGTKLRTENTNLNINVDMNDYLDKLYDKRVGEEEDLDPDLLKDHDD